MKESQLLYHLGNILEQAQKKANSPQHICFFHGQLMIASRNHTKEPHKIFENMTPTQLSEGWNTPELNQLTKQIFDFLQDQKKCLNTSKL